ncbi:MAG: uroporphyrinogen decarboxylase family protein [Oscillospiraceae bacterium]|jgi:uroporphyrinogen decarboxylase|nr:uroporphyrinogen decarboxylase family protein [Oscillospiraceae bacterium]
MTQWLASAAAQHKPLPILSFPGVQLIGCTVRDLVFSGEKQAACMSAVANRFDMLASVSLMDLSVEAEAFGSPVRFSGGEVPTVTAAIIAGRDDLDKLALPQVGAARTGEYVNAIRLAKTLIRDRPVFAGSIGPFSLAGRLMDMTEIMALCYEEPELVHGVLEKVTQFMIEYNTAFKTAGADGVIMAEPAAGLLSPALIAEFSTPYVRRIIEAVQTDACVFIYHNCGRTLPLIGSILETGAEAFHFGNAIDLSEMLPLVPSGKPVFGNVDPAGQLRGGTAASVRAATLELLSRCAKYPNFILSSGCDIPPVSPLENIEAFFAAAKAFYGN